MRLSQQLIPAVLTIAATACSVGREAPATASPSPPETHVTASVTAAAATLVGERAPVVVEGALVHVNNRLCGVSRSPMDSETIGRFVSRVEYNGNDPRFQGKTFEFSQCCGGCLSKFPQLWAERADEILAFHGVELPPDGK